MLRVQTHAAPTLLLSDTADPLVRMDRKAAALRPDFSCRDFSDGGSFALMRAPLHWAEVVVEFARAHGV